METSPGDESQKNDAAVAAKRAILTAYVETHRAELESGDRVLLFLDECFLHWGDVCGYGWGRRQERLVLPIGNPKARQTFYGALDAATGAMHVATYPKAEQDATTDFLTELRIRYPGAKLTIFWDNASWHQGPILAAYLAKLNDGLPPEEWVITCFNFAPHDPRQNPIEDVWLYGKTHLRHERPEADQFVVISASFEAALDRQFFDFPKRRMYGDLQIS